MELRDYLTVMRRYWRSITAVAVLGVVVAGVTSFLMTPTYTSTTSLVLTTQSGDSASELAQGTSYTERQVKTFAEVAAAPYVLQPVIDDLGLELTTDGLAERLDVTIPVDTAVLTLAVTDTSAERAAAIAAAIAQRMEAAVADLAPRKTARRAGVTATIISPAEVPTSQATPQVSRNLVLGLLLGVVLGSGQAFVRSLLDTQIRTTDDVARVTELPVVGTISLDPAMDQRALAVITDPLSTRAEEVRRLRTNLQFLGLPQRADDATCPALVFTSSVAGEGKTATTVNTALSMAAAGKRVLLIDADLRRPKVAELLNLEGSAGLTTVLIGRAEAKDVIQSAHGVDVLASGDVPPNPSEMLGSEPMRRLLDDLRPEYDYVLLDAAPLVPVTDAAALSSFVTGVIMLVGSRDVRAAELHAALESIHSAEGQTLGLVLNKLQTVDAGQRRSGDYYGYGPRAQDPGPRASADVGEGPTS